MAGKKELEAVIAVAGKLDPSLASSISKAQAYVDKLEKRTSKKSSKMMKALSVAGKASVAAVGAAAVAGGVFIGKSIQKGMEFDSAMSQVAATLGTTTDQIGDLRQFALKMGSTTAFTATQAAEGLNYMALAGYDADKSMAMLPNVLNLAAAGNMELGEASDMVTDAQSALGLSIEQTNTLVDQMAKAASTTNTSVSQLGEAILTVGGTAQYMAGGTAGVNAALGVLADNGIKASEGGTHLRNILLKLANPTSEATKLLDDLGVKVFDDSGKMRDFAELFPELNDAMSSLTDEEKLSALSTLFNARDIASASALLGTTKDRWDEVTSAIGNANGAAAQMAATQLDNLQGDITLFKSALEGAQITLADALNPALRDLVKYGTKAVTDLTDAFNENGLQGVISGVVDILDDLLNGLIDALPDIVQFAFQFIAELALGIVQAAPRLLGAALQAVVVLANGLIQALPVIIPAAFQAVIMMAQTIADNIWPILYAGIQLVIVLADSIMQNLGPIVKASLTILVKIAQTILTHIPEIVGMILEGLGGAIVDGIGSLASGIGDFFMGLFGGGEAESAAESSAESITSSFEMVPLDLESSLGSLSSIAESAATDTATPFEGLGEDISLSFDEIPTAFQTTMDTTLETAQATAESLGISFDGTGEQIQTALGADTVASIQANWEGLGTFFTNLSTSIVSGFTAAGTEITTAIGSSQALQVQTAWGNVQIMFQNLAAMLPTLFVAEVMAQPFVDAYTTVETTWTQAAAFFASTWAQIAAAFMMGAAAAVSASAIISISLSGVSSRLYGIVTAANSATSALRTMASAAESASSAASVASAAKGPGKAKGGFTNGPELAGEDPRYPMEAVISFNPAYRAQNVRYLNTAARMLGLSAYEKPNPGPWSRAVDAMSGDGLSANVNFESTVNVGDINFAPNITIAGNASQDDIVAALRRVQPEFTELVNEVINQRAEGSYEYDF